MKIILLMTLLATNMKQDYILSAVQQQKETQSLVVIQEIVQDKDFMNCLFLNELKINEKDCLSLRHYDSQHQEQVHFFQGIISQIYHEDSACASINQQGNQESCEQHIQGVFLTQLHSQGLLTLNVEQVTSIAHDIAQYYSQAEEFTSLEQLAVRVIQFQDLHIVESLVSDESLMRCVFETQILKKMHPCPAPSDQTHQQYLEIIEGIVSSVYHKEQICLTVDVLGHFSDCHTHVYQIFEAHFQQTVIVSDGFNTHLMQVTEKFTSYFSQIIHEDFSDHFHKDVQGDARLQKTNLISNIAKFESIVMNDQFMSCYCQAIVSSNSQNCLESQHFDEDDHHYASIINQVIVSMTQTHQECIHSPQPEDQIICEEHVESLLLQYTDETHFDQDSDPIVRISEAIVSYLYQDTLVSVKQEVSGSTQSDLQEKQENEKIANHIKIVVDQELAESVDKYSKENELLKDKLLISNQQITMLNDQAKVNEQFTQQLEEFETQIKRMEQQLLKNEELLKEAEEMQKIIGEKSKPSQNMQHELEVKHSQIDEELKKMEEEQSRLEVSMNQASRGSELTQSNIGKVSSKYNSTLPSVTRINTDPVQQQATSKENSGSDHKKEGEGHLELEAKNKLDPIQNEQIATQNESYVISLSKIFAILLKNFKLESKPIESTDFIKNYQKIDIDQATLILAENLKNISDQEVNQIHSLLEKYHIQQKDSQQNKYQVIGESLDYLMKNACESNKQLRIMTDYEGSEITRILYIFSSFLCLQDQIHIVQSLKGDELNDLQDGRFKETTESLQTCQNEAKQQFLTEEKNTYKTVEEIEMEIEKKNQNLAQANKQDDEENQVVIQILPDVPRDSFAQQIQADENGVLSPVDENSLHQDISLEGQTNREVELKVQKDQGTGQETLKVEKVDEKQEEKTEPLNSLQVNNNQEERVLTEEQTIETSDILLLQQIEKVTSLKNRINLLNTENATLVYELEQKNESKFRSLSEQLEQAVDEQNSLNLISEYKRDLKNLQFQLKVEEKALKKIISDFKIQKISHRKLDLKTQTATLNQKIKSINTAIETESQDLSSQQLTKAEILNSLNEIVKIQQERELDDELQSMQEQLFNKLGQVQMNLMQIEDRSLKLEKTTETKANSRTLRQMKFSIQTLKQRQRELYQRALQKNKDLERKMKDAFEQRHEEKANRILVDRKLNQEQRILRETEAQKGLSAFI